MSRRVENWVVVETLIFCLARASLTAVTPHPIHRKRHNPALHMPNITHRPRQEFLEERRVALGQVFVAVPKLFLYPTP